MTEPVRVVAIREDVARECVKEVVAPLIARLNELEAENTRLRKGIEDYRAGNYESPRSHRPNPCPHGMDYWQECDACNDAALAAILAPIASGMDAAEGGRDRNGLDLKDDSPAHAVGTP